MSEDQVFESQRVRCRGCGQSYHQTTEEFDPTRCATGRMFKLLPAYGPNGANWTTFPCDEAVRHGDLVCPGCGESYTNGGNTVTLIPLAHTAVDRAVMELEQANADPEIVLHHEEIEKAMNEALDAEEAAELAEVANVATEPEPVVEEEPNFLDGGEDVTLRDKTVDEQVVVVARSKKIKIGGK